MFLTRVSSLRFICQINHLIIIIIISEILIELHPLENDNAQEIKNRTCPSCRPATPLMNYDYSINPVILITSG